MSTNNPFLPSASGFLDAGELDEYIEEQCSNWRAPGLAFAMSQDGRLVYEHMSGFRDVKAQLPITMSTVFGVASITKSVTALAVMCAQDEGLLSTGDPVTHWLPELAGFSQEAMADVRIRHLLSHTSGFPGMSAIFHARAASIRQDTDWRIVAADMPNPFSVTPIRTVVELMDVMKELDFRFLAPPGELFNYSNEGYALLQEILERATNCPFVDYATANILHPLQMSTAVFRTTALNDLPEVTQLYGASMEDGERKVFESPAWWDVGDIFTNGSLKASIADILQYLEFYRCGGEVSGYRVLSRAGFLEMTAPHVTLPTGSQYGYGLFVNDYHGVKVVAHSGGIKGVSAHMLAALDTGITAVALCNLADVPVSQVTYAGLNHTLKLPLDTTAMTYGNGSSETDSEATAPSPIPQRELAHYVGRYQSDEGDWANVDVSDGSLVLQDASGETRLHAFAMDGFVDEAGRMPIRFLRDAAEHITAVFYGVRVLPKQTT